jgi:hypothetical protein
MMPGIDPRSQARKKRARIGAFITAGAAMASSALSGTRFSPWEWVPWVLGLTVITVFTAIAMAASGGRPGGRERDSGLSGRGRDDDGPAGTAAHRWHMLVMVSRGAGAGKADAAVAVRGAQGPQARRPLDLACIRWRARWWALAAPPSG